MKAKQLQTICTVLMTLLFLWNCSGPSEKLAPRDSQASNKEARDILPDTSKELKTSTGKTLIISETFPAGHSLSNIKIKTLDFEHNYLEIFKDKDPISNILLADLDNNGFDEIYIITTSAGSGSYGNVLGLASNKDKSLSMINFPEIEQEDDNFIGYMGHDSFTIENRKLLRTFPVFNEGDANHNPTGGTRKLIYGLYPGEAMWQLIIENMEMSPN